MTVTMKGYVPLPETIIGDKNTTNESWGSYIAMKDTYYAECDAIASARIGYYRYSGTGIPTIRKIVSGIANCPICGRSLNSKLECEFEDCPEYERVHNLKWKRIPDPKRGSATRMFTKKSAALNTAQKYVNRYPNFIARVIDLYYPNGRWAVEYRRKIPQIFKLQPIPD